MKTLYNSALAAAIVLATSASPALAQRNNASANPAPTGPIVPGIGVANVDVVVASSAAYQASVPARETHYAQTLQQAAALRTQLQAQLSGIETQVRTAQAAAVPNQTQIQQLANQYRQLEQQGMQQIQEITTPLRLAEAFVVEQIQDQLVAAVTAVRTRRRLSLIVMDGAVYYSDPAYDVNQDLVNELNRLVPVVQVAPPEGWLPRQLRQQQAAQQAAQQGQQPAPPATPAGPLPEGR